MEKSKLKRTAIITFVLAIGLLGRILTTDLLSSIRTVDALQLIALGMLTGVLIYSGSRLLRAQS